MRVAGEGEGLAQGNLPWLVRQRRQQHSVAAAACKSAAAAAAAERRREEYILEAPAFLRLQPDSHAAEHKKREMCGDGERAGCGCGGGVEQRL